MTHRLVNATTGVFTWSKDHGATVRSVTPAPSSRYVIGGDRNNNIDATFATTRQLESDGDIEWSADHGNTVWAVRALAGGDVWSAGSTSSSVTHRRYNSSGTQQQTINATPLGGGVAVDPNSGRIWAYKSTGGTDPVSLSSIFGYNSDGLYPYSIGTLTGNTASRRDRFIDHDDSGNLYLSDGYHVEKYTNGVLQWASQPPSGSVSSSQAGCFGIDRASGDAFVGGSAFLCKLNSADGSVAWTHATSSALEGGTLGTTIAINLLCVGNGKIYTVTSSTGGFGTFLSAYQTDGTWLGRGAFGFSFSSSSHSAVFMEFAEDDDGFYVGTSDGRFVNYPDWTPTNPPFFDSPSISWQKTGLGSVYWISSGPTHVAIASAGTVRCYTAAGTQLWTDTSASFPSSVCIHGSSVYGMYARTNPRAALIKHDLTTGTLQMVRYPKSGSLNFPNAAVSVSDDEIAMRLGGSWGTKVFDAAGDLLDVIATAATAIEFDSTGKVIFGSSTQVFKMDPDTYLWSWVNSAGTVDLAVSSANKVLAGTGTLLRQLAAATGVADWSKNVVGTIASVAYDTADNPWVAHTRASSITHRKYNSSGTQQLTGDHTGNLTSIRCDSNNHPIIGGARV